MKKLLLLTTMIFLTYASSNEKIDYSKVTIPKQEDVKAKYKVDDKSKYEAINKIPKEDKKKENKNLSISGNVNVDETTKELEKVEIEVGTKF